MSAARPSPSAARLVRVAVPVPALGLLTYEVPESLAMPVVGARVLVPVGPRKLTGCVAALGSGDTPGETAAASGPLKAILEVLDEEPFVPPHVVALVQWTAEYYVAGPGETMAAAMPPLSGRRDGHRTMRMAALTAHGMEAAAQQPAPSGGPGRPRLGIRQREALDALHGAPGGLSLAALADLGIQPDAVTRLVVRGFAAIRRDRIDRDPFVSAAHGEPAQALAGTAGESRVATDEQRVALSELTALADARAFHVALLHGVTGSGKTEIYLRLAAHVLAQGRRTLILVPEIALTPALAAIFRAQFGERVAIQHSGLSDGERYDQWQRIRRGEVDMVVGTRSAVFAPLSGTGLIIVDEEHDSSYKQEESPRYHGRNLAVMRGRQEQALVVLGSATPALETYQHARTKRYAISTLDRRVLDRPLASVRIVDMREVYAAEGPDVVLSPALREALGVRLERREQALVLLNRRGFSTAIFCRQCGGTFECPNCSVSLTVHGARDDRRRRARCHYCNYSMPVATQCPACAAPYLEQVGFGTERVEADIRQAFPAARVARIDRDSIRRRGALPALLSAFADGRIDVLVGTQMIAKGHDFPRVTLVGVISADVGLGVADFRAAERTFQLLTQVAGRAGRGERPGEAIVQTIYPDHYSIELACRQDYRGFFERELAYRRAMHYPPVVSLINVVVRGRTLAAALNDAAGLVQRVRAAAGSSGGIRVLGPAPAPLARLRGEYRVQFFLKGTARVRMRDVLREAVSADAALRRRIRIDVDPVSML